MSAKLINYAYPTSETAVKSGYGNTGCYYISIHENETSHKELSRTKAFQHKKDAIAYADSMAIPYHTWHYKYFNIN